MWRKAVVFLLLAFWGMVNVMLRSVDPTFGKKPKDRLFDVVSFIAWASLFMAYAWATS